MPTAIERFWSYVDQSGDCWLWTGARCGRANLYGSFSSPVGTSAHRFAYAHFVGPIPAGMQVDHRATCPKHCVNPAHLRLATPKQDQENRLGAQRNSGSGVRGVSWDRHHGKWVGKVQHHGKKHCAGFYDNIEDAREAVRLKRIELFTHNDADRASV